MEFLHSNRRSISAYFLRVLTATLCLKIIKQYGQRCEIFFLSNRVAWRIAYCTRSNEVEIDAGPTGPSGPTCPDWYEIG